ncbi:uncharacterized protein K02A2.6-like [Culex pipiens pallens]|uniref:uncharacterized protein K02A2.6-like n=1 Tax=Culex pipiens pallens TaxID=42434 RepID=UPI0019535075|nr:uncharacterized protein K02A2.6-like [Culex pipiens pallens]
MRLANRAIKREAYMMPTFEDFLPRLTEARFFSRLDIKEAFHQLELDEDSRYITTFITHKGLYRYKRLLFGISCASEMFQRIMEQILSGCKNVVNYIDDILVFGKTKFEHDQALEKVLTILKDMNVLLNHSKCVFGVTEVVFLGHHLSANGIRPAEDKLAALKSFRAPESAEELRSFLGLVNYVGRFLPDLATVTAPLRNLIGTGTRFIWEAHHQVAFVTLKDLIANVQTLSYFDNTLRTRLIADASPVALGAVLVQFRSNWDDSNPLIISYASKSLTPTEMKYSQTEKEGLALVWGVERHAMYLLGRRFELETDHKPLEAIFAPFSKPCARMERWVLRLQAYTFKVIYKKGVNNIADSFSRLATTFDTNEFDGDNSYLILLIAGSAAIDTGEIEEASYQDEEFAAVRESLQNGIWKDTLAKPYEVFKNELGFVGDILVRGTRLVVPQALRKRMIELGHEGHPGETVMKSRLRDRVWWPGLDKEVLQAVKTCEGCRLTSLPDRPEPMARRRMPTDPWIDVAIDFLGPLPTGEYLLVIIDYFSRYKEVEIMTRITAKDTASRLDRIFTRLGYPVTITSDNGRQFASDEFDRYCRDRGITLNFTTPYWPQENGLVEKQNRSLLKRLQISHSLKRDWKADLQDYLMMYYTTPHTTTGKTPTELAFGRTIRSKIPSIRDLPSRPASTDTEDRDLIRKTRGKEIEDAKRKAKSSEIAVGDTVLMRNLLPGNKLTPNFGTKEYTVVNKQGSRFTITDKETNKTYLRNASHLKKVITPDSQTEEETSAAPGPPEDMPDKPVRRYPGLPEGFRDFTL